MNDNLPDNIVRISEAIDALCEDNHLVPPGTVIVSANQCTIMPEFYDAPISALLSWSEHLDGKVNFLASLLNPPDGGNVPTVVTAHGTLNGVRTVITAHTMRTYQPLLDAPDPWTTPIVIPWVDVVDLSLPETPHILPTAKDQT